MQGGWRPATGLPHSRASSAGTFATPVSNLCFRQAAQDRADDSPWNAAGLPGIPTRKMERSIRAFSWPARLRAATLRPVTSVASIDCAILDSLPACGRVVRSPSPRRGDTVQPGVSGSILRSRRLAEQDVTRATPGGRPDIPRLFSVFAVEPCKGFQNPQSHRCSSSYGTPQRLRSPWNSSWHEPFRRLWNPCRVPGKETTKTMAASRTRGGAGRKRRDPLCPGLDTLTPAG